MSDDADPPRKACELKAGPFKTLNAPADQPQAVPAISVQDHLRYAQSNPRAASPSGPLPKVPENEIHAILRGNVARSKSAGLEELEPLPKRRSRRKLDFFITLVAGNLVILACAMASGFNSAVMTCALGGVALFTVAITWVMWFVMDDY